MVSGLCVYDFSASTDVLLYSPCVAVLALEISQAFIEHIDL